MSFAFLNHHVHVMYELTGVLVGFAVVIGVGGLLLARVERIPTGEAMYFAVITALTVGFGDVTPKTTTGRIVTVLLALIGLILVGIFVAIAGRALELAFTSA